MPSEPESGFPVIEKVVENEAPPHQIPLSEPEGNSHGGSGTTHPSTTPRELAKIHATIERIENGIGDIASVLKKTDSALGKALHEDRGRAAAASSSNDGSAQPQPGRRRWRRDGSESSSESTRSRIRPPPRGLGGTRRYSVSPPPPPLIRRRRSRSPVYINDRDGEASPPPPRRRGTWVARSRSRGRREPVRPWLETILPKVRVCNFAKFMSNYRDQDTCHAIDVLVAGDELYADITDWEAPAPEDYLDQNPYLVAPAAFDRLWQRKADLSSKDTYINRIRLNSPILIQAIGLQETSKDETARFPNNVPVVFQPPFKPLLEFNDNVGQLDSDKIAEIAGIDMDNKEHVALVQCLCDFVETYLVPRCRHFRDLTFPSNETIRFEDLSYIFRKDELMYAPGLPQRIWRIMDISSDERIRVRERERYRTVEDERRERIRANEPAALEVECYYLDYDGSHYRPVTKMFYIQFFNGKMPIMELESYPLRYVADKKQILDKAMQQGKRFLQVTRDPQHRYGFFSGWTQTFNPQGREMTAGNRHPPRRDRSPDRYYEDGSGRLVRRDRSPTFLRPEHVNSDVLVDFLEAFSSRPEWRPVFYYIEPPGGETGPSERTWPVPNPGLSAGKSAWHDYTNAYTFRAWRSEEDVNHATHFDIFADRMFRSRDLTLPPTDEYLMAGKDGEQGPMPSGHDLALFPTRVFAYAIWPRKFVAIELRHIQEHAITSPGRGVSAVSATPEKNSSSRDVFDKLQIGHGHKKLIQSIVHSHFENRELENSGIQIGSQDIIRGKGRGLVILLHGVPGVGKTATAEAVAQRWGKPLFPITCGDLGFTPESVQNELEEIFRLAHLWDCVLLLDEADVFITQRERNELQRNALVSVFLRMLEYYHGILFLTTNRPGVLDEAVKSRVHITLQYDQLDEDQTVEVFRNNIERLKEIEEQRSAGEKHQRLFILEEDVLKFAREQYRRSLQKGGIGRWNGRQIRNAFTIAASMAHFEGEENPGMQRQLRASHFETVEGTTLLYDQFRQSTLGKTDSEAAMGRAERDDDFRPPRSRTFDTAGNIPQHQLHSQSAGWSPPSQPLANFQRPYSQALPTRVPDPYSTTTGISGPAPVHHHSPHISPAGIAGTPGGPPQPQNQWGGETSGFYAGAPRSASTTNPGFGQPPAAGISHAELAAASTVPRAVSPGAAGAPPGPYSGQGTTNQQGDYQYGNGQAYSVNHMRS